MNLKMKSEEMKQFIGNSINIDIPYIGRVDAKHDNIHLLSSVNNEKCLISSNVVKFDKVFHANGINLNIGDIVKITPLGRLIVLYEAYSDDNALFISEKCNNHCIMCPQVMHKNSSSFLQENIEVLSLIIDEPKYIGITGGEPTEVWNDLIEIVKFITQKHPSTIIQLLTNGRIFKNEKRLIELKNISNKILYCIPLYSDIPDIHDRIVGDNGAFYDTIDGIYNLAKFKLPVELRTVITKINYKRLSAYTSWICTNLPFISHLAIMGMEPIYQARKNLDEVWIDPIDYYDELYDSCRNLIRNGLPFFIYNHQLCVIHKELRKYCCKSISDFKQIYLGVCNSCVQKGVCGGLFESAKNIHSRAIRALRD